MKPEPSIEDQIEKAIEDVKNAMLENIEADKAENDAKKRKKLAHYALQQANQRMHALQMDMYSINLN